MLSAVEFYDQSAFNRAEVGEVGTYRMLTAELHVAHSPASQMTPEDLLRRSLLAAQSAGGFVGCFG